jgi:hypothetical protein
MEVPLNEATDAVHALRLIGYGLEGQGEEEAGRAVAQIAWRACQRLDAVKFEINVRPFVVYRFSPVQFA